MLQRIRNWFTNTRNREAKHNEQVFEVEKEHAYLTASILELWDYIAILETRIAGKLLKLDPEDIKQQRRKPVEIVEEEAVEEQPQTYKGMKVFGGKSGVR